MKENTIDLWGCARLFISLYVVIVELKVGESHTLLGKMASKVLWKRCEVSVVADFLVRIVALPPFLSLYYA